MTPLAPDGAKKYLLGFPVIKLKKKQKYVILYFVENVINLLPLES